MSQDHNFHQTDLPVQMQILNISVNMARIGELVLKFGEGKSELREKFLVQTQSYLADLDSTNVSGAFLPTLEMFNRAFGRLRKEAVNSRNQQLWAERAITWADILQIRSRLV